MMDPAPILDLEACDGMGGCVRNGKDGKEGECDSTGWSANGYMIQVE